jgi:hypothetical protein
MGALPGPVPHQGTTHQNGQQGLPAEVFNPTVGTAPAVRAGQKGKAKQQWGRAKRGATAASTDSDHPTRTYQNPWVSNGGKSALTLRRTS